METIPAYKYCKFVTDGTHDSPKRTNFGRKLITSKHLGRYALDFQSANYISEEDYLKIIKRSNVEQWDILFSMIGTVGNIYIETMPNVDYACKNVGIFQCGNDQNKSKWLYYYLQTPKAKKHIYSFIRGTTQGYIPLVSLRNIPIDIIDFTTRDKIIQILWLLDEKIKNNMHINDNLEQQAQAIFKAWFVDFEPFGGIMPDDWKVYKLGDFLPVITGKKNANVSSLKGKYPFFSCSHDISWTDEYSFDGYAILVAGNGDFNVKWYDGKFEAYQRTYVLIPKDPRYTSWLYYAVKHNLSDITRAARGSVISFITKSNLEEFSFVAPKNLEKFNLIDKFISINKIIDHNIKQIYLLTSLRDTLLPKLMSGEIDVSNIEI
ncbi:restriction endonuclease subunit S [Treponema sp. OMZ 798]|nr:restriction endonuclease subunit S [Treponema sp. OMZ 798]